MGPKTAGKQKVARTKPINSEIRKTGVMRLSRGRMFHKRGLWHVEKWRKQNEKKPEDKRPKKPTRVVEKQVGGDKNGGKRRVRVSRFVSLLPILINNCNNFIIYVFIYYNLLAKIISN